ncbi:MAG: 4a-hydroxytetrahydrobiopterin dehydratase [Acidimicrobiales bacterium]
MADVPPVLSHEDVDAALADLEGWERDGEFLRRDFEFDDFVEAFSFMAGAALVAEKLFHHPEWSNVYNRVSIAITTHDAGGLTDNDLEFARRVSSLV